MAGGKETPRQKMIGMMYLVLLALLALQMGQSILTKFRQLEMSLDKAVVESVSKNVSLRDRIASSVKESGKQEEVLTMSEELRKKTATVLAEIDAIKKGLIEATDGYTDETKDLPESQRVYVGMKDTDKTSTFLLGSGEKKDGKAYELKKILDGYVKYVNDLNKKVAAIRELPVPKDKPSLALDAKDDPMFKDDKDRSGQDFAHVNFDHTEMIASMAFLSERQSNVANLETDLQNQLAGLVGAADFKFDNVFAMAKPKSSVVAAGTMYEAELFVSASSQAIKPEMKTVGAGAVTMKGGTGHIKFRATPGAYDKFGNVEKSWTGLITIKKPIGSGDTTLPVKVPYTVSKPVIQVQAGSVSALYRNCANPLTILVPALGAEYEPKFTVAGGVGQAGKNKGDFIVYPTGKTCAITVKSGGNLIGTESFKTKGIPLPTIVAYVNGKPVDQKKGMVAPGPRSITVKAVPEAGFADALPREKTYNITKWSATLVRGRRPAGQKKFSTGDNCDISSLRSSARPGDRIMIEVNDVVRINSRRQSEEVNVGTTIINVPLN